MNTLAPKLSEMYPRFQCYPFQEQVGSEKHLKVEEVIQAERKEVENRDILFKKKIGEVIELVKNEYIGQEIAIKVVYLNDLHHMTSMY